MGFYQGQIVPLLINLSMRHRNLAAYRMSTAHLWLLTLRLATQVKARKDSSLNPPHVKLLRLISKVWTEESELTI